MDILSNLAALRAQEQRYSNRPRIRMMGADMMHYKSFEVQVSGRCASGPSQSSTWPSAGTGLTARYTSHALRRWFVTGINSRGALTIARRIGPTGHRRQIIVSSIEHPSIMEVCELLRAEGYRISMLPVSAEGVVNQNALADLVSVDTQQDVHTAHHVRL
jgi:hypothetical protein